MRSRLRVAAVVCFVAILAVGGAAALRLAPATPRTAYAVVSSADRLSFATREGETVEFLRPELRARNAAWIAPAAEPVRTDGQILYDHGPWSEIYVLREDALQQCFVIKSAIEGPACIRIPIRSGLTPRADAGGAGVELVDAKGTPRLVYKDAYAMDRAGHIAAISMSVEDSAICLHLSPEYLASATFPVLIDPVVGAPGFLSSSGGIWRAPGMRIAYSSVDNIYLAVWHRDVVFDDPPSNHGHQPHYWLTSSRVDARAISVAANGTVTFGAVRNLGPAATGFAAFAPRVTHNPVNNEFLVVWSEGKWEVTETPDADTDGDTLIGNDPDRSIFGDLVTDLNDNNIAEFAMSQDPVAPNTRIVAQRVSVAALATSAVGAPVEVTMAAGGVPGNPTGPAGGVQDPTAVHPAVLPDVTWDGLQYVLVWQTLEDPQLGDIESIGGQFELRHIFHTKSRTRYSTVSATGAITTTSTDLSNAKHRFFIKGATSDLSNIIDGSVPANLGNELVYDSVPTDPGPRVASLVLPGTDGLLGTADDINGGSLMTWCVTTLVFNEPKSRVRSRLLPAGSSQAGIVWDVFSGNGQLYQRVAVAAGPAKQADNPATPQNETLDMSHFFVLFQRVDGIVSEGNRAVEFIGAVQGRMTEENGVPSGALFTVADPDATGTYLSPTLAWNRETEQYFVSWTKTDSTLWNPITEGRAWFPRGWTMLDSPNQLFAQLATVYPQGAALTSNPAIDPNNPAAAEHHVLFGAQEDDFGANYTRRYKFPPTPIVGDPAIFVSPPVLSFNAPDQVTIPPAKTATLGNSGGSLSVLQWEAVVDQSWLTIAPMSGTLGQAQTQQLSVSVNPGGLPNGTYNAMITITSPTAINSGQTIAVAFVVGGGASGVDGLFVAPTSITTSAIEGATPPAASLSLTFNDQDSNPATINWTVTNAASLPTWIAAVTPLSGTLAAPNSSALVGVTFDTSGLVAGTYQTTIAIASTPAVQGSPLMIPVTLTITPGAPPPPPPPAPKEGSKKKGGCGGSAGGASSLLPGMMMLALAFALALRHGR